VDAPIARHYNGSAGPSVGAVVAESLAAAHAGQVGWVRTGQRECIMKRLVWLGVLGLLALSPLLAKEIRYRAGFVKYSVPDEWKVEAQGDNGDTQKVANADGELHLHVFTITRDRGTNSMQHLKRAMEDKMTDVNFDHEETRRVNDLIQYHVEGKGRLKDGDRRVEFKACWVQVEGQEPDRTTIEANTVFFFHGEHIGKHEEAIRKIYDSIEQRH
jgi:hypothetical protein